MQEKTGEARVQVRQRRESRAALDMVFVQLAVEILADDGVHDAVDPLVAAPVRLALDALLDPARAFGMPLRAFVEAVDDHLEPVVAEVEDQQSLEEACGLVRKAASPEVAVHRQPAEACDAAALVDALECERPGALAGQLDDQAPARVGLLLLPPEPLRRR